MGAFDIGRHKYSDQQKKKHSDIDGVGVGLPDAVVGEENNSAEHERKTDPHYLLAGKFIEVKQRCIVEIIAGGVYAHRSCRDEQKIKKDCDPVDAPEHRSAGVSVS